MGVIEPNPADPPTPSGARRPQRIQRRRVKGWRMPENARSVTRPGTYGNPYKVGKIYKIGSRIIGMSLENTLTEFERYVKEILAVEPNWLEPLRGKDLACFCPLDQPCHADILLRLANQEAS